MMCRGSPAVRKARQLLGWALVLARLLAAAGCRIPGTDLAAFRPEPVGRPPSIAEDQIQLEGKYKVRSEHAFTPRPDLSFPRENEDLPPPREASLQALSAGSVNPELALKP